jgi:tRNA (guanine37-N1)-methyltransferase
MRIDVLTLFPDMLLYPLSESIVGKARKKGLLDIRVINIRDFAENKHKRVDDYPYGGGAGMVMQAQPIFSVLESIDARNGKIIYPSPKGKTFDQKMAIRLSKEERLTFICGHYEGIDQRIIDYWVTDEVSIGDYVLTGGELPAMVIIDAVSRMIPGVLGQEDSYKEESFYSGLLEYPHYTRPSEYKGLKVPDVLLSGHHQKIEEWRKLKALQITYKARKDLFEKYINRKDLDELEKRMIEKFLESCIHKK